VVAAVAVAAVVAGGVIASRQGPVTGDSAAVPLTGDVGATPTPGLTPSAPTPSAPASSPPASAKPTPLRPTPADPTTNSGPTKVTLTLSKLTRGRDPQVTYVSGREVRGGAGTAVTVPGSQPIITAARYRDLVLVVLVKGTGTELIRLDGTTDEPTRVPQIATLAVSPDQSSAAYATARFGSTGGRLEGSTVYFEAGMPVKRLERPRDWDLRVLAVVNDTVYFRSSPTETGSTWNLYSWATGKGAATRITTVGSPSALSSDASKAASIEVLADYGTCSALIPLATGKRLWRTCEYRMTGFTPGGGVVIAAPAMGDGYADLMAAVLDTTNGNLLRKWSGLSFRSTVAEDDDHLLMLADDGPESKAAIIRCTISTGACELATPLTKRNLVLS
jgi:hypothetical protein